VKKYSYIIYFILSAVLLTVVQQPFNLSFLAWVAYIPFVLAAAKEEKLKLLLLSAYVIGALYWGLNLYWLVPITIVGWAVLCLYLAVYWPMVAAALNFTWRKNIPMWFVLPVFIVGEETLRGWLFGWRFLAHSQFRNISLIQIADVFGTAGITFIIAMAAGVICDFILSRKAAKIRRINYGGAVITVLVVAGVVYYGRFRINQTLQFTEPGPKIGVVQCNVPVKAGVDAEPFEKTFLDQLALSREAFYDARPLLIVWPETMVETLLDKSYLSLVGENYASKTIHNALVRHAREGVYVLVGAFGGQAYLDANEIKFKSRYNTAFLYEPNQPWSTQQYHKIHLVPFGEYIPLKKQLPFLYRFLLAMTPYDYDYTLQKGTDFTNFQISSDCGSYNFAVSICYEDTVPDICRKLVAEDGIKNAQWLVNISNDGWFVKKNGDKFKVAVELRQHMAICVFRAVENRVPVVRCANTGISCIIDSIGNIKDGYLAGTLSQRAEQRTGQAGWLVDTIKIDNRTAIFSKHRQFLGPVCALCLILSVVMTIYNNRFEI